MCDNVGDHLIGNVYARYEWETEAQKAVDSLNTRWYAGASRLVHSLTPQANATTFRSAQVVLCTLSFRPSQTSGKHAAARMKTASATVAVSATSCTCVMRAKSSCRHCARRSASSVGLTLQRRSPVVAAGSRAVAARTAPAAAAGSVVPARSGATGSPGVKRDRFLSRSKCTLLYKVKAMLHPG